MMEKLTADNLSSAVAFGELLGETYLLDRIGIPFALLVWAARW